MRQLTTLQKESISGANARYEQLTLFDDIPIVDFTPFGARMRCSTKYCGARAHQLHWGYETCTSCIAYRELTGLLLIE